MRSRHAPGLEGRASWQDQHPATRQLCWTEKQDLVVDVADLVKGLRGFGAARKQRNSRCKRPCLGRTPGRVPAKTALRVGLRRAAEGTRDSSLARQVPPWPAEGAPLREDGQALAAGSAYAALSRNSREALRHTSEAGGILGGGIASSSISAPQPGETAQDGSGRSLVDGTAAWPGALTTEHWAGLVLTSLAGLQAAYGKMEAPRPRRLEPLIEPASTMGRSIPRDSCLAYATGQALQAAVGQRYQDA